MDDAPFGVDNIFGWAWMEYVLKVPALLCLVVMLPRLNSRLRTALAAVGFAWAWADDVPPLLHIQTALRDAQSYWYPFDIFEHTISLLFFYLAID